MFRNEFIAPDGDQGGHLAEQATPALAVLRVQTLLADAAAHYQDALRTSPQAQRYLWSRGIGGAIAARFGLGFARPKWRDLGGVLERHDDDTVQDSGLLAGSGEGENARRFDRFRGRVMFPIRTRTGAVAGFGGRVIDADHAPKYLNSPEGPAFKKRELLYGLCEAQDAIRAEGRVLVVEGYLDVIAVAQAGFAPVVGTMGTACSASQLAKLLTLTRRLVFCFDGDDAGRRAAARALETVAPFAGRDCAIDFVFLPEGEDPDSFVRRQGLEGFEAALRGASSLQDFLIEHVSVGCDMQCAEGRALCAHRARPLWFALPDGPIRSALLDYCVRLLRFPADELLALWYRAREPHPSKTARFNPKSTF